MSLFLKKAIFVFAVGYVAHAQSNPTEPVRNAKQLYADIKKVTTDGYSKDFSDLPTDIQNERKSIITGSVLAGIAVLTTPTIPMEIIDGWSPNSGGRGDPISAVMGLSILCYAIQETHNKMLTYVGITPSLQLSALTGAAVGALLALKYLSYKRRSIASFKSLNRKGLDLLIAHKHDLKKFKEQFEALIKKDEPYPKNEATWELHDLQYKLSSFLEHVAISKDSEKIEAELKELIAAIDTTQELFRQDVAWQKETKARNIRWIKDHKFIENNLLW